MVPGLFSFPRGAAFHVPLSGGAQGGQRPRPVSLSDSVALAPVCV